MRTVTGYFAISAIALFAACVEGRSQQTASMANGVYAVLREGPVREDVEQEKAPHYTILYDRKYLDENPKQAPKYVALDSSSFVPLILASPPEIGREYRGHPTLHLALSRQHAKVLEEFTRAHLNGTIAIVIDREIITMHRIRSVITDGQVQISRCTDNACQILRIKLLK